MYRSSDSDSIDSDKGIRYKTDSIRNKDKVNDRDKKDSYRRERKRSRSKSRSRYHDHSKKKLKKRKREYSSEDEEHRRTKSKGRKKDKKDVRRHREREDIRKDLHSVDKKIKSSDQCTESLKSAKKDNLDLHEKNVTCMVSALPPHLSQKDCGSLDEKTNPNASYKSKLSSVNEVGPSLPPDFGPKLSNNSLTNEEHEKDSYGPSLPPYFKQKLHDLQLDNTNDTNLTPDLTPSDANEEISSAQSKIKLIGPTLPPHIQQKLVESNLDELETKTVDPTLAPHLPTADESGDPNIRPAFSPDLKEQLVEDSSYTEDDEVYGPVPVGESFSRAHVELEERALKIKIDQLEPQGEKQPSREEWMLTLPETKAAKFGLGPRSFRAKAGPDLSDRSSWTDTPEDKARKKAGKVEPKVDLQKEAKIKEIQRKDKEQEALAKKSRKHKESLLEMHQKQQKNKDSASGPSERRPFSREIDLQVNRFDEAQKKAVLKKAQLLDTRFSAGESKYL